MDINMYIPYVQIKKVVIYFADIAGGKEAEGV